MSPELQTTNVLLGIMAAVSVLEAALIIGAGIAGFMAYRRVTSLIDKTLQIAEGIEARQVAPAMLRVHAILDDVKGVTSRVKEETQRVDHAIHSTIDRIDDTADRVRTNVRAKTSALVHFVRSARMAVASVLRTEVRT